MKEQRKRKTSFFEAGNRSSLFQIIPLMYQFSFIIPTIYNNINMPIGTTASAVYHESYFEQASGLFLAQLMFIVAVIDEGEAGELLLRPQDDLEFTPLRLL